MTDNVLTLSDLTQDWSQFVNQFDTYLANTPTWAGSLTTQTSTTLVELISAVGAFNQGRIIRAYEDGFAETAQSDDAIRAITQMQGLRMSRKLPSGLPVTLTSTIDLTLNPQSQFTIGGQYYFNREQLTLQANVPINVTLFQGQIVTYVMNGLGGPRQTFISEEDEFSVSDQDVLVILNSTILPKSFGGLWNFNNLPAYSDLTTADGRLLVVFGSNQFGTTPATTDTVIVSYPITTGADGSNQTLLNNTISATGWPTITGTATANPSGGGDEQPIQTYKNLASGAFGTYSSAVTKSQYEATVGVYPGIIDAFTQAQRDINPLALEWMNVIRISALTSTPWTQTQIQAFINYLQTVTMYSGRFLWQAPIPVLQDVQLTVYCFNTTTLPNMQTLCYNAIQALFAPTPGLLMTNFYISDLINTCIAAGGGGVSYVTVQSPTGPMIVTAPPSPVAQYTLIPASGTLNSLVYAYGITSVNLQGVEGTPSDWVLPQVVGNNFAIQLDWEALPETTEYKIYGRAAGKIGLLATVLATAPLTFTDDGSIVPSGQPPNAIAQVPIQYNALGNLSVTTVFAERQQQFGVGNAPIRAGGL